MKKLNNNKNKLILPLIASLSVSSIALLSIANVNNNSQIELVKLESAINSRSMSSNTSSKNNLMSPNELFYLSTKLNDSVNVWDDSTDSKNQTNYDAWNNFKTHISNVQGDNPTQAELITIATQAVNVESIKSIYKQFDELKKTNPWLTDTIIQSLKDEVKAQTGFVESMNEIAGVNDIPQKLLSLSGIEEGTKIASIQPVSTTGVKITDLTTTSSGTNNKLNGVAGQDYTYLVKIAEIDPNQEGNYALTFNYKKSASSSTISGTLFIKNEKDSSGNLPLVTNKDNLSSLNSSLDVFGRWTLGANGTLGSGNYDKEFENFVIQKGTSANNTDTIEVLVRLKDGQSISNIQWGNDVTIPGALNLQQGTRLGILDVQADENNTFKSAILGTYNKGNSNGNNGSNGGITTKDTTTNTGEYPSNGKLVSNISDSTIITKVKFFSDTLTSKKVTTTAKEVSANRSLTFWQYGTLELSLPLYYAVNDESDISNNTITYNPISIYTNGTPTSNQQTILLSSSETTPTTISPNTYSMFSDLKNKLPSTVQDNFVQASTITLTSSLYSSNKVTKQELKFYDNFYAIGNRDEGWNSIDVSNDIKFIKIQDPTQKIFFEQPFDTTTIKADPTTTTSTMSAQETINERTAVIGFLGNIYEQFSKANSGDLSGEQYNNIQFSRWYPKGSNNSNIVYETQTFNGSAYQLYTLLNNTWKTISPIMDKMFNITTILDRYDVSKSSAATIVNSYIAFISEFTVDSNKLESLIAEAVSVVKAEKTNITEETTYDSLSSDLKKQLGQIMSKMIQLQLDTISNEFQLRLSTPLYDAIKSVVTNDTIKLNYTINTASSFLESKELSGKKLIKYKDNGWDQIISNSESTLSSAINNMLEILYYNNANTSGLVVYLGNSIFNTGNLELLFNSYSTASLTSFVSDTYETQSEKVAFYGKLFSIFTNYNIQNEVQDMLRTGSSSTINTSEVEGAFKEMLLKLTNQVSRIESVKDDTITSYYLDDIISGANAIISLKWKLEQISSSAFSVNKATTSQSELNEIQQNIQNILTSNEQMSSSELSIWSNIILGSTNYSIYTENLSGRNGEADLISMVDKMVEDSTLLTSRAQETMAAVVVLEYIIKYLWWPIIALIGLGIIISSSIGLATKDRKIKLSARPVVKWLLVASIVLGVGVLAISIILGLPVLGLPAIL